VSFLAILAGIPFIGYILSGAIAVVLVMLSLILFKVASYTLAHIVLFGSGAYLLLRVINHSFMEKNNRTLTNNELIFLAAFSVILIIVGIPNVMFSVVGQPYSYQIVNDLPSQITISLTASNSSLYQDFGPLGSVALLITFSIAVIYLTKVIGERL
jgi:hypothetical protein